MNYYNGKLNLNEYKPIEIESNQIKSNQIKSNQIELNWKVN